MAAFCHHCGVKLPGDSRFCHECGAAIPVAETISNVPASVAEPMQDAQGSAMEPIPSQPQTTVPKSRRAKVSRLAIWGLAGLIVLIMVIVIVVIPTNWSNGGHAAGGASLTPPAANTNQTANVQDVLAVRTPSTVSNPAAQGAKWTAMNVPVPRVMGSRATAHVVTGDVVISRNSISMHNKTYPLIFVRDLHGDELNFANVFYSGAALEGQLFRTKIPAQVEVARKSQYSQYIFRLHEPCGSVYANWIVALTTGDRLYLAFFWSYLEPPLSQPTVWGTARGDPSIHFCGIYEYEKAAQRPAGSSEAPQEAKAAPVEDSKPSAAQPEVIAKAEAGDAASQNLLGVAYCKHGKDVPQDYAKAAEWFRKAADQGLDKAQRNLAVCYENGQGVRQDYARAAMWYRKAAEQGDVQAQYKVGVMYAVGQGVPRDYAQGAIWSRKAAEQGNVNAQFNIGLLYEKGQGVLQDYAQAAAWLRKAVEQGDTEAKSALDRVQREAEETKVK